jgi:hypothetical protein
MPEQQTITRTVYQFDELSDRARERVIEQLTEDYVQTQDTIECLIDPDTAEYPDWLLPTYHDVRLHGGGTRRKVDHYASWGYPEYHLSIGYVVDIPGFMRAHKIAAKYRALYNAATEGYVTARVTQPSGYSASRYHAQYDYLDLDADYWATPNQSQIDALADLLEQDMNDRIERLSGYLRDDCEYHASEEYIRETCDANEYRFTEHGEPV